MRAGYPVRTFDRSTPEPTEKERRKTRVLTPTFRQLSLSQLLSVVCRILPHCAHVADMNYLFEHPLDTHQNLLPKMTALIRIQHFRMSRYEKPAFSDFYLIFLWKSYAPSIFLSGFLLRFSGQIPFFFYFRTEWQVSGGLVPSTPKRKKAGVITQLLLYNNSGSWYLVNGSGRSVAC